MYSIIILIISINFELNNNNYLYLILLTLCGSILLFGLNAKLIKYKLYLNSPILMIILGIIIQQSINDIGISTITGTIGIDNKNKIELLKYISSIAISIQVMATALDLPANYFKLRYKIMFLLLIPGLIITWILTGLILYLILFNSYNLIECLLISSVLTPTDPILCHIIISGEKAEKLVPLHIRRLLNCESAANDGLAYPFVLLPLLILSPSMANNYNTNINELIIEWIVKIWLYENILGIIIGLIIGYLIGKLFQYSINNSLTDHESIISYSLVLSLFILGLCTLIGCNGLLGSFTGGIAFNSNDDIADRLIHQSIQDTADFLSGNLFFLILGIFIPIEFIKLYNTIDIWQWIIICIYTIALRRIPALLLFNTIHYFRIRGRNDSNRLDINSDYSRWWILENIWETIYISYFGPIGVAATFYSILIIEHFNYSFRGFEFYSIILIIVLVSIIIHGITATPLTNIISKKLLFTDLDQFIMKNELSKKINIKKAELDQLSIIRQNNYNNTDINQ